MSTVSSLGLCLILRAAAVAAQAISVPPSLRWDGVDGSWSTFTVRVGGPDYQTVHLLPGTAANAGTSIWVVLEEGCTLAAPNVSTCAEDRGGLFQRNESSTWSTERLANEGLFELTTSEESKLGLGGNAYYGFDTVQLGYDGFDDSIVQDQLIAGIAGYDFWVGSLGLSPRPFNFSEFGEPVPSFLTKLREQGHVSSSSWAYTAGASYQDPPVYGSLTLGGHDRLRYDEASALEVPLGAGSSRDLLVGVQSIQYDTLGSKPLLSTGVYAYIDSLVTDIWLPVANCIYFELAFNLTWNFTDERYWIDDELHESLLQQNPSLNFTLGASSEPGGEAVNVVLPYAAMDLTMGPPFAQSPTRYFPLKRAQNSSQYTLGRVFLQEAYVLADYDSGTFTVAQALFPTPASAVDIVEHASGKANGNGPGLDTDTIAGIVVAVCVVAAILAAIFWYRRSRKSKSLGSDGKSSDAEDYSPDTKDLAELQTEAPAIQEMTAAGRDRPELPGQGGPYRTSELDVPELAKKVGTKHAAELPAEGPGLVEMQAGGRERLELPAERGPWQTSELAGSTPGSRGQSENVRGSHELPGSHLDRSGLC